MTVQSRATKSLLIAIFCFAYHAAQHNVCNHRLAWQYAVGVVMDAAAEYELRQGHLDHALRLAGSCYA